MNKNFSKNHSPFYSLFAYGGERVKLNLKIPPRKLLPPIFYFYFVFLIKFCSRKHDFVLKSRNRKDTCATKAGAVAWNKAEARISVCTQAWK